MKVSRKLLITILTFFVCSAMLFAADRVDLRLNDELYLEQMSSAKERSTVAGQLGLSSANQLREISTIKELDGLTHSRSRQFYMDVPVFGEHIIVSRDNAGKVVQLHGRLTRSIEDDLTSVEPAFSEREALDLMKSQNAYRMELEYTNEKSELSIYIDEYNRAHLVYVVSYFADLPEGGLPSRPYYIVDAQTKEVLEQWEGLTHSEVGTGPGGNLKTGKYEYGTDYGYLDVSYSGSTSTMTNSNVKTVNMNHGTTNSSAYSYSGKRNSHKEINGAYSPLNDAHYFGGIVYKMYNSYVGTAPLTFQLVMRVHYSSGYENAFWNGSSMTFGDGGSTFYPLVCLDVSAHEVSHGFTEQNSALVYKNQSGGINEAFSDMAGEAAEYYMKNTNDFMVGGDIFKSSGALRYMNTPTKDGKSIDKASSYTSGMDVHYSSGVYNKAFYLLATASGWDTKKAFKTFAYANRNYWTPNATFQSAATGVYDAAAALGYDTKAVVSAFAGVGISISSDSEPNSTLGDGVDNSDLTFSTSGDGKFATQTSTYYYDGDAVQAGAIDNNQKSVLTTTVKGPATLSFYWKVSSEANYDYLRVAIDGTEQSKISGSTSWAQKSLTIGSGSHTITWTYTKDAYVASGSDTGWVDKVVVE